VRGEDPELVGRLTVATRSVRHFPLSSAIAEPPELAILEHGEGSHCDDSPATRCTPFVSCRVSVRVTPVADQPLDVLQLNTDTS
jgi:hypothetical protein